MFGALLLLAIVHGPLSMPLALAHGHLIENEAVRVLEWLISDGLCEFLLLSHRDALAGLEVPAWLSLRE
jgi:hypothetical protein